MRWPITLDKTKAATITQIEPTWRTYLTVMKNTVADLAWRGDYMNVDNHRISESLYMFTRHDNSKAVGYFFNPNKQTVNSLIMPGLPAAAATIKIVNPRDGSVIAEQNVANVQSFSLSTPVTDHAVVIASGTFATVNEDAVGGSTPVDQLPVAQLFVSAGFQLQIAQITGLGLNLAVTFNITPDLRFILALDKLTAPVKQYSQPAQLADDFSVTIPVVKMHDDSELNNVVLKLADQTQWIWRLDSIDGQKF